MTTLHERRVERFSQAIDRSGLSQSEIARQSGFSRSAISSWRSGRRGLPGPEDSVILGRVLKVRPEWLLGVSDEMEPGDAPPPMPVIQPRDGSWIAIPRLLKIAAGVAEYSPLDGKKAVLTDRRALEKQIGPIDENHPEKTVFAALVHGDSMAPRIDDGDTVIVQKFFRGERGKNVIENGKLYVLNMAAADDTTDIETKASVKRLIQFGHELHVLSDNTRHPVRTVDLRRIRYLQALILGRPVQLIRDL